MLFGNIKCWGNVNGVYSYPSSNIENDSLVPLLSIPIETNPNLRVFQYWFTESFLPWSIVKNYIKGKDILGLLDVKELNIVLLNYLTYLYNYDRKFQGAKYDEKGNPINKSAQLHQKFEGQKPEDVIDGLFENWKLDNPKSLNENAVKRFKQIIYMLSNYTYSKYAINKGYNDDNKLFSPYYFELISTPNKIEDGYWEFKDCQVLLNSLYFNFSGGPIPPKNYWKEVHAIEKPFNEVDNKYYFVVWRNDDNGNWKINKFKNNVKLNISETNTINESLYLFNGNFSSDLKIYLEVILKNGVPFTWFFDRDNIFLKSFYRWDGNGGPDTPFIGLKTGQITDWNLKQQNNINNNDKIEVTIKNKDISENPIYQLEANYFNWLSITNELETNNIPSLIPAEIKLSDREYGKYLTNLIISNDKIEEYLNCFSQQNKLLYSKKDWTIMTKDLVKK